MYTIFLKLGLIFISISGNTTGGKWGSRREIFVNLLLFRQRSLSSGERCSMNYAPAFFFSVSVNFFYLVFKLFNSAFRCKVKGGLKYSPENKQCVVYRGCGCWWKGQRYFLFFNL